MTYLFVWTDRQLSENLTVMAPAHMVAIAKAFVSDEGDESDSDSAASDSQLIDASKVNSKTDQQQMTMSDIMVAEILGIFKNSILSTHRCRCVQFYVFHVVRWV